MNNNLIPAATVLVLKDSDVGMEVLMVKRSKRPPFENLYVFPGGKIDKDDHFDDYQKYCDVLNNEIASEKLGLDSGGLSYWIACIRECFEEVGILLAKKQSGEFLDLDGADKEKFDVAGKHPFRLATVCGPAGRTNFGNNSSNLIRMAVLSGRPLRRP